jgi:hypothetical protein
MKTARTFVVIIATAVVLFVWSGLTQLFPWGVPSATVVVSQSTPQSTPFQAANIRQLPAHELTTPQFDRALVNHVTTLTTDETFSWIVSKPIAYYSPTNYFLREALTQLIVALLLVCIALLTRTLALRERMLLFLVISLAASAGSYGQLLNWWGLTPTYALGASVNLIAGWLIAGLALTRVMVSHKPSGV